MRNRPSRPTSKRTWGPPGARRICIEQRLWGPDPNGSPAFTSTAIILRSGPRKTVLSIAPPRRDITAVSWRPATFHPDSGKSSHRLQRGSTHPNCMPATCHRAKGGPSARSLWIANMERPCWSPPSGKTQRSRLPLVGLEGTSGSGPAIVRPIVRPRRGCCVQDFFRTGTADRLLINLEESVPVGDESDVAAIRRPHCVSAQRRIKGESEWDAARQIVKPEILRSRAGSSWSTTTAFPSGEMAGHCMLTGGRQCRSACRSGRTRSIA